MEAADDDNCEMPVVTEDHVDDYVAARQTEMAGVSEKVNLH